MRFSAALLVKQTCRQLNYHVRQNLKKGNNSAIPDAFSKLPTQEQIEGNEWADKQTKGLSEMRGQFNYRDHTIYFSFDEVKPSPKGKRATLIEHKQPSNPNKGFKVENGVKRSLTTEERDEASLRYFQMSVIQVALFAALFHFSSKLLCPASFSKETENIDLQGVKVTFKLNFGGELYYVYIRSPIMIARFYLTKLRASLDYEKSLRFDNSWKNKEWQFFKDYVRVRKA